MTCHPQSDCGLDKNEYARVCTTKIPISTIKKLPKNFNNQRETIGQDDIRQKDFEGEELTQKRDGDFESQEVNGGYSSSIKDQEYRSNPFREQMEREGYMSVPMFQCREAQNHYIHYTFLCDHQTECPDGSDEDRCDFQHVCPSHFVKVGDRE